MFLSTPDTQLCVSLSARPGGFGNRFHNYLYGELKLDYVYRAGTTDNLAAAIAGLRALRIRGCGLSMPFKEQVLPMLDEVDPIARRIGAVNTVVNDDVRGVGRLVGYNTDWLSVRDLLKVRGVGPISKVAVFGSGGMARAVAYALSELGCREVTFVARNRATGEAIAREYGYKWVESLEPADLDVLINASPVGMAPDSVEQMAFTPELVRRARIVMDSVATPADTTLLKFARECGHQTIAGFDVTLVQGVEQFRLYTGVTPRVDQIGRAAVYARHRGK